MKALIEAGSSGRRSLSRMRTEHLGIRRFREHFAPVLRQQELARLGISQGEQAEHRDLVTRRGRRRLPRRSSLPGTRSRTGSREQRSRNPRAGTPRRALTLLATSPRISGSCTRATVSASFRASCIFAPNEFRSVAAASRSIQ